MVARVPEAPRWRYLEQRETEQRPARRVDRPRQIGLHPCYGAGSRVGLAADIDDGQGPGDRLVDELPWFAGLFEKPKTQRLALGNDLSQGALEQRENDGAIDLNIFADVVSSASGVDLLGKPDAKLRARQRQRLAHRRAFLVDLQLTGIKTQIRH